MNQLELPEIPVSNRKRLEDEIESILDEMSIEHSDTEKYTKMAENLQTLCSARSEYERNRYKPYMDKLIGVCGTLVCIMLIMNYEKADTIVTKALAFIPKF